MQNPRRSLLPLVLGMTRVEWGMLGFVFLLFLAVMFGPLAGYLKRGRINRAIEDSHTIATLLSQYSTDNDGVYPVGEGTAAVGKSEGIARDLLANNYTPDPSIFALSGVKPYAGAGGDFADFNAENISWDFTAGATTTTGLTADAPDLLPVVYTTGENVTYPPNAGPLDLALSGHGPFGDEGVVAAYKIGNAVYLKAQTQGKTAVAPGFISKNYQGSGTYSQIKP